jgi:hypothetical protein
VAIAERQGGFGSTSTTDEIIQLVNQLGTPNIISTDEWYQLGMDLFKSCECSDTFTTENRDVEYLGS